jgi:TRAP-type mannitol/chloroaromatic compound transport system permease small subunit
MTAGERLEAVSAALERALARLAAAAAWLFLVAAAVIGFDVVTRKFGYQLPGFGSTRLQELQWHLHTALFAFWLGYAYTRDAHVRIDTLVAGAGARARAALELVGCLLIALPFCAVGLYFALDYSWTAWLRNEASESPSGLPYRFVPKGLIAAAFLLLTAAVVARALRALAALSGRQAPSDRTKPLP